MPRRALDASSHAATIATMQLEFGASGTSAPGSAPAERRARERALERRSLRTRTTRELMRRLHRDAHRLCNAFSLRYRALEAERAGVKSRYGACFSDGTIKIRLYHATTARPLKYSSLIDTLCHELAHLRYFNHGKRFQDLYQRILIHARRERIYRPGLAGAVSPPKSPPRVAAWLGAAPPERPLYQLSLFG